MGLLARFSWKNKRGTPPTDYVARASNEGFRGVRVIANNEDCCQFVRSIADERFLLEEAPKLPISICDAESCHCTYERFEDRRAGARRAADIAFDISTQLHGRENRSVHTPGRRSKDTSEYQR
jgi:hypothetical protein